ncbi:alpha/beta hydrolase [Colletotrichum tofieldiae]|nr:alpha/beta hydrolase [Colletotrichum tofieldiae]
MDFFKPPIVLIHGLWMTPLSWEHWIPFFQKRGFEVHAPGWPGVDGRTHEEIRADPKPIALHRIEDIVDHYEAYIKKLPEPPIIIGHSFGGLFAQILLSRGLGALGIAVCPAQPAGIIYIPPTTIRAAFPIFAHPYILTPPFRSPKATFTTASATSCRPKRARSNGSDTAYRRILESSGS